MLLGGVVEWMRAKPNREIDQFNAIRIMNTASMPVLDYSPPGHAMPLWPLSVEQYHDMIEHGILTSGDPIELLEGFLVRKMSKKPPHSAVTTLLREALANALPPGWAIRSQEPITTLDSEPEPDIAVVKGMLSDFMDHHPVADEVLLVIEVAETSLLRDRGIKKRLYARAGLPVYWIVNLPDGQIEVYQEPDASAAEPDYRRRRDYRAGTSILLERDGVEICRLAVSDFLVSPG